LVVGCSLLVEVSVHGGMLTMTSSWWGKNVITPIKYYRIITHKDSVCAIQGTYKYTNQNN